MKRSIFHGIFVVALILFSCVFLIGCQSVEVIESDYGFSETEISPLNTRSMSGGQLVVSTEEFFVGRTTTISYTMGNENHGFKFSWEIDGKLFPGYHDWLHITPEKGVSEQKDLNISVYLMKQDVKEAGFQFLYSVYDPYISVDSYKYVAQEFEATLVHQTVQAYDIVWSGNDLVVIEGQGTHKAKLKFTKTGTKTLKATMTSKTKGDTHTLTFDMSIAGVSLETHNVWNNQPNTPVRIWFNGPDDPSVANPWIIPLGATEVSRTKTSIDLTFSSYRPYTVGYRYNNQITELTLYVQDGSLIPLDPNL